MPYLALRPGPARADERARAAALARLIRRALGRAFQREPMPVGRVVDNGDAIPGFPPAAEMMSDEAADDLVPNQLPIGSVVGDFRITGVLGVGGFGIVYRADDLTLGRVVAVKEYLPASISGRTGRATAVVRSQELVPAFQSGLRNFLREARMLARFSHPALVDVYRVWEQNGTAYMAMRCITGRTLREAHRQGLVADEAAIAACLLPVLDALALLHAEHVVHRDVSPDNIMLREDGSPVLLDLGSARQVVGHMTQALTTVLKPGYAPLEQYVDDGALAQGPWTDVYAVGATLYTLITGAPPPQSLARMMSDPVVSLEGLCRIPVSDRLCQATLAALAVRPEKRLRSIEALRDALGWALPRLGFVEPPTGTDTDTTPAEVPSRTASAATTRAADGAAAHTQWNTVLLREGDGATVILPKTVLLAPENTTPDGGSGASVDRPAGDAPTRMRRGGTALGRWLAAGGALALAAAGLLWLRPVEVARPAEADMRARPVSETVAAAGPTPTPGASSATMTATESPPSAPPTAAASGTRPAATAVPPPAPVPQTNRESRPAPAAERARPSPRATPERPPSGAAEARGAATINALSARGAEAFRAGDVEAARRAWRAIVDHPAATRPSIATVLHNLAISHCAGGQPLRCEEYYLAMLRADPASAAAVTEHDRRPFKQPFERARRRALAQ